MNKWVLPSFLGSGSLLLLWQAQRDFSITRLGGGVGESPIKERERDDRTLALGEGGQTLDQGDVGLTNPEQELPLPIIQEEGTEGRRYYSHGPHPARLVPNTKDAAPCRTRKTDNEEGETDEIPGITKRTGPPPEQVQQQGGAASHIQGEDEGNLVQPSQTEAASSFFQGISVIAKQIFNAIGKASDE
ncbi:unnamed protein product [Urochloa humidicola]